MILYDGRERREKEQSRLIEKLQLHATTSTMMTPTTKIKASHQNNSSNELYDSNTWKQRSLRD